MIATMMPSLPSTAQLLLLLTLLSSLSGQAQSQVLVLGATGRTGSLLYHELKQTLQQQHNHLHGKHSKVMVRALVRDPEKARDLLQCHKCDETEGIFVGDIRNLTSLLPAFDGVSTVAIATGVSGRGNPTSHDIRAVEFEGVQNAVKALAQKSNLQQFGGSQKLRVVLCSSRGTTTPPSNPGVFGNILFYKLNAEAFLGSVGMVTSIVKPCGLSNDAGANRTLLVLHDDAPTPTGSQMIPRADVARVMAHLAIHPPHQNLRFDVCSIEGPGTTDLDQLIDSAQWSWQHVGDASKTGKKELLQQVASMIHNRPARFTPPK